MITTKNKLELQKIPTSQSYYLLIRPHCNKEELFKVCSVSKKLREAIKKRESEHQPGVFSPAKEQNGEGEGIIMVNALETKGEFRGEDMGISENEIRLKAEKTFFNISRNNISKVKAFRGK